VTNIADLETATKMLRRFRKQLDELPPEWRTWILAMLATGESDD
jgi:hypothetical protein